RHQQRSHQVQERPSVLLDGGHALAGGRRLGGGDRGLGGGHRRGAGAAGVGGQREGGQRQRGQRTEGQTDRAREGMGHGETVSEIRCQRHDFGGGGDGES